MFFKSNWISKSTLYLSQAVWEANETICKEKPLLIKFELRSMKNFKTFGVLLSYISWEQFDNLKLTFCLYQVLWNANEKNCKLNVIFVNFAMKNLKKSIQNSVAGKVLDLFQNSVTSSKNPGKV